MRSAAPFALAFLMAGVPATIYADGGTSPDAARRAPTSPSADSQRAALGAQLEQLMQRQANATAAASVLAALAKEPKPAGLPASDERAWPELVQHTQSCSDRTLRLVAAWRPRLAAIKQQLESASTQPELTAASKALEETNMSFNLQYLGLQQAMQAENRKFTLLSNILKARRDTAKNAIGNVR